MTGTQHNGQGEIGEHWHHVNKHLWRQTLSDQPAKRLASCHPAASDAGKGRGAAAGQGKAAYTAPAPWPACTQAWPTTIGAAWRPCWHSSKAWGLKAHPCQSKAGCARVLLTGGLAGHRAEQDRPFSPWCGHVWGRPAHGQCIEDITCKHKIGQVDLHIEQSRSCIFEQVWTGHHDQLPYFGPPQSFSTSAAVMSALDFVLHQVQHSCQQAAHRAAAGQGQSRVGLDIDMLHQRA